MGAKESKTSCVEIVRCCFPKKMRKNKIHHLDLGEEETSPVPKLPHGVLFVAPRLLALQDLSIEDECCASSASIAISEESTAISEESTAISEESTAISEESTAISEESTAISDTSSGTSRPESASSSHTCYGNMYGDYRRARAPSHNSDCSDEEGAEARIQPLTRLLESVIDSRMRIEALGQLPNATQYVQKGTQGQGVLTVIRVAEALDNSRAPCVKASEEDV
uniref:Uncharacterized protein n=1 Tax=Branchiostoma floridae TaxID=7739 RepID=C3ZB50_BRAFL|eukprot:XP_002594076.1 hypothetical protein BRAFLDRAFT_68484 [Branchiostoma floridae]